MAYVVLPLILLGREPHQQGTEHPSLLLWLLVRREESAFHRQDKLIYTGEPPLSRSFPPITERSERDAEVFREKSCPEVAKVRSGVSQGCTRVGVMRTGLLPHE